MGIKFYCPSCEKRLNVKSFLAGKTGYCPHCQAKVHIPTESEPKRTATSAAGAEAGGSSILPGADRAEEKERGGAAPTALVQERAVGNGRAATGQRTAAPAGASTSSSASRANQPGASPPNRDALRATVPAPQAAAPGAPSSGGETAAVFRADSAPKTAGATVAPTPTPAPVVPQAAPVVPQAAPADPIAEAPHAVWYVRPPSGGQYGPAVGDIMRKWIHEGRVSAETLVWREGWPDWRPAGKVFPALAPAVLDPSAPAAPAATPRAIRSPRRQSAPSLAVAVIVVLGLLAVVLFVGLLWVLGAL